MSGVRIPPGVPNGKLNMYKMEDSVGMAPESLYQRVGGKSFFIELVDKFYDLIESEPILRKLYPDNLEPGKANLALFLAQFWGGPQEYSAKRGHPRLRLRHMPFTIGKLERDTWVTHMKSALHSMDLPIQDKSQMLEYFENTATFMINQQQ